MAHYQDLKEIVEDLNGKGRSLVVCNDHDKDEFILFRIKERGPRRVLGLFPGKKGRVVYETPALSRGRYGFTSDTDVSRALRELYGDSFEVKPMRV